MRIQSVARAVRLLMLVAGRKTDGSGKALAEAAGLPVPTAHHLLATLVAESLLAKDPDSRYVLGPKAAIVAEAVQRDLSPPGYLLGGLNELAAETGETCYVAVWRQGEIHLAATRSGSHPVQVAVPSGPYSHPYARATGKAFLAHSRDEALDAHLGSEPFERLTEHTITSRRRLDEDLERVRERGYAIDEEEFQDGVCCVSVPVMGEGFVIAAYSMSVPRQRWADLREALIEAARRVARSTEAQLTGSRR